MKPLWVLILLLPALSGCTMTNMYLCVVQEEATGLIGEIKGEMIVGQSFSVLRDDLARVDLAIATYDRENRHSLLFRLSDSDTEKELAILEVSSEKVNPNGYTPIVFAPVEDSAGRRFTFQVSSPDSRTGDAFSLYYDTSDVYKGGTASINGQPIAADLAFRAYTREVFTPAQVREGFVGRAARDLPFWTVYGLLLAGVVGGLVWASAGGK